MKKTANSIQLKLGKKVRHLRQSKGFSQEEFAFECGLHRTYIGSIERGETSITINSIEKIAKGLKITMSELLDGVK